MNEFGIRKKGEINISYTLHNFPIPQIQNHYLHVGDKKLFFTQESSKTSVLWQNYNTDTISYHETQERNWHDCANQTRNMHLDLLSYLTTIR